MKALAFLVIIVVILLIVLTGVKILQAYQAHRRYEHARWHLVPKSPNGPLKEAWPKEAWLICRGEDSYLYGKVELDVDDPEKSKSEWDMTMFDAEVACGELNRMRKEQLKLRG